MKKSVTVGMIGFFAALSSQANLAYRLQNAEIVGYDETKVIVRVPGGKANFRIPRKSVPERNVAYRGKIEVVTGDKVEIKK
jgi:hypothetical protein